MSDPQALSAALPGHQPRHAESSLATTVVAQQEATAPPPSPIGKTL